MSKLHMCEEKGAHLPECSCECEYYAFGKINVENALISADQASDTLTLVAGDNIFLYPDLDNNSIRIEARDQGTVYEGGTGIFVEDHSINHTNSINEGTVGSTTDTSGYTIIVPYVTYDAQGHISDAGNRTHTVPTPPTYSAGTGLTLNGTTFNHSNSVTAGTAGSTTDTSGTSISIPYVTYDAQGHITASGTRTHTAPSPRSAGTGLSLSGNTLNHSNSITAGTAGSTTDTSGASISIPYVTYDAQGHITASGTRTHTAPSPRSAGTGLSLSGNTLNHSNSITAGTAGSTTDTSGTSISIPYVTFDAQGHITAKGTRTHTVPSAPTYSAGTGLSMSGTTINHSNSVTAGTAGSTTDTSGNTFTIPYVTFDAQGHITAKGTRNHTVPSGTTYSAGTGLSLSGTTFNHSNSVTAGTAGSSTDTSGNTFTIPYVTYDSQGHITASGTRNHTVSGGTTYTAGRGMELVNDAFSRLPLIDEVVCMAVSHAPGLTGTYSLIKRCFEPAFLENDSTVSWNSEFIETTSARRCVIMRTDDRLCVNLHYALKVGITETTTRICSIPMDTLGITDLTTSYTIAHADGVDSISFINAYKSGTNLIINTVDFLPHGQGNPAGEWDLQIDLVFSQEQMSLSACNRFYYKRTA